MRAGLDAEPASDWISTQRASAKPGSEGEISVGKPCQNEYRSIERNRSQRSAAPAYVEDINRQQLERNQASPRDQPVHHPELQSSHTDYPSFEQQQPPQQLSSKSVDNRHVGRGVRFNGEDSNDGPAVNSSPDVAQRSSHNQDLFGASRRAGPQEHHRQEQLPMHGRTSKEVPQQQQALYSGKTRRSERGDDTAASGGAPDPVPKTSVHQYGGPVKYEIPPQTAAGIAARQKVGFDDSLDGSLQAPAHRKHHLSNILHHGHKNAPNSSPQLGNQPRRLDEWRQGGTARLTAADLVVATDDANDKNAWWEKGKTSTRRTSDGAQFQGKAGIDSGESVEDYGQDTRSFNPPLYLKCGPLLRYTGLKRDKLHASRLRSDPSATERESWHGSVMIVTTDEGSDYSTPPTLMLFPEPIELLPPPPQQVNGESRQSLPSEYIDPVAGLPKLSRTGTTVYVKPVEDLEPEVDLSRIETDDGLFEETRTAAVPTSYGKPDLRVSKTQQSDSKRQRLLGKTKSKSQSVKGVRLHAERGVTFWRFNLEVELGTQQTRIAYCINNGSSIGFWVPAKGQSMNIMFHSCNGFSMSVK